MNDIDILKILFAVIAMSFVLGIIFDKNIYICSVFYGLAFILLCISMFITRRLPQATYTNYTKTQLIITEFVFGIIAIICLWNTLHKEGITLRLYGGTNQYDNDIISNYS